MGMRFTKLLTVFLVLFVHLNVFAQETPITIHVEKAGTLSSYIASSKKYVITNLTVSGSLNRTDISYLRDMAGMGYDNKVSKGTLTILNLEKATIVDNELRFTTFQNCKQLISITLPNSLILLGDEVFQGCSNLTTIKLPDGLTTIGKLAFNQCVKLSSIDLPESLIKIGEVAFNGTNLTTLYIPQNVSELATVGWGVRFSYERAVRGMANLTKITVSPNNQKYASVDGILFSKDLTLLHYCPPKKELTSYKIPDYISRIKSNAFRDNLNLSSITIPNDIEMEDSAFGEGIIQIQVLVKNPPKSINGQIFQYVNKDKCVLYVPIGSYDAYWLAMEWGNFKNIVEGEPTPTSNETIESDKLQLFSGDGHISVNTNTETPISIYKFTGELVKQVKVSGSMQIMLPAGSYIIRTEKSSYKAIVK